MSSPVQVNTTAGGQLLAEVQCGCVVMLPMGPPCVLLYHYVGLCDGGAV